MNMQVTNKKEFAISKAATVIVFLALIRCISEVFRLEYYSTTTLTFEVFKPFLIGALTAAIALLVMTIFSFYGKYKLVIAIAVLAIVSLLIEKYIYVLPF